jgi:pimeloyl-ACP methyl ester carboxylesterase
MTRLRVKVDDGVVLAVDVHGDDASRPTVVLVHGYPDTSSAWNGVVRHLASRYRVVTYDVRGAGASTAPGPNGTRDVAPLDVAFARRRTSRHGCPSAQRWPQLRCRR